MAEIATGSREDALDLVQDAMLALVRKYADRAPEEWPPLFHRILQSRIRDWYRRSRVRNRFRVWFGRAHEDSGQADVVQSWPDDAPGVERQVEDEQAMQRLSRALHRLPLRQQQAFLLRAWEGLDTAATARAMACSEGSVKTHYSRALAHLREQLGDHWP